MKLVTAAEMRLAEERAAQAGTTVAQLMEQAGLAVARETRRFLGGVVGKRLLVLVGPGNNGGDGLVAAFHLRRWGGRVHLYLCSHRPAGDENLNRCHQAGIPWTKADEAGDKGLAHLLSLADAVLDALFGTGKARPLEGVYREALIRLAQEQGHRPSLRVIAVDLPSGVDADTGRADPAALRADLTVTLGFPKRGLFALPGASLSGRVVVADIGLPPADGMATELMDDAWAHSTLPPRPREAHKGTFGRLLAVAGCENYVGAAYLAATAAYRVGAGLVTLACTRSLHPLIASRLTEATYLPLPEQEGGLAAEAAGEVAEALSRYDVLLVGCGLGQRAGTDAFLASLLPALGEKPSVWDGDGLNWLARLPQWWHRLPRQTVLTPHPAEFSRLTGMSLEEVQRLEACREMAKRWDKVVVLKGAFTVVASPDGEACLSPFANPGLASAGTGDVLAGAIAGLLAQGLSPFDAASLGVYLHGRAGEMAAAELGEAGMVASDLLPALPRAIKALRERQNDSGLL